MKLYTEEQVRDAIELAREKYPAEFIPSTNGIISYLTPTELPSDEEIEYEASDFGKKYRATTYEKSAYVIGAKWMRDKILNKQQ